MFKKDKKDMLSKEEARDLICEWADQLSIDSETDKFNDVIDAIQFVVRKKLLKFNREESCFDYVLLVPIKKKDDSDSISIVKISEMDMEQKKVVQRYKDNESIEQATALMAQSLGMGDQMGFVSKIKGRDSDIINAVIMGFFTGVGN